MNRVLCAVVALIVTCGYSTAVTFDNIRFHNESSDTTRINNLLIEATGKDFRSSGECIAWLGEKFDGTPYVAGTLEADSGACERLTVNLDEMDCTTFVETVLALAYTAGERRSSWRDFIYNLERIRYRNGELNGYSSRLHYVSDWIVDNTHRGVTIEATRLFPKINYEIKSLNFMTSNRKLYPALADNNEFQRIKSVEIGYRNHRFPYIKAQNVTSKENKSVFRNGDIVAFTTSIDGLDVSHMGIVLLHDGQMYLLHASSTDKKVEVSSRPLAEIFRRNRNMTGLRVIRLKDW